MFHYFGYGSNINLISLKAKGVKPLHSEIAILKGWKLKFNVEHWFKHEGGVGNIEPGDEALDWVEGVLHQCKDEHLQYLDLMESYGVGYDRIQIKVQTKDDIKTATTYVGLPSYINDSCLPTRRYMNIILNGARKAGLSKAYLAKLENQPVKALDEYPQFTSPDEKYPVITEIDLKNDKSLTGLCGLVFNMSGAREKLHCLFDLLGGKDMTLFHIKRHDTSTGMETMDDYLNGNLSASVKNYLNAYLHEYNKEFELIGRYRYDQDTTLKSIDQPIK